MFCFKCGASMPDESPNCPQCGAAASEAPQIAPRATLPPPPVPPSVSYPTAPQPYPLQLKPDAKATWSMILGIVSLTCPSILAGIPAVVLGHIAKSNIRKSGGRLGGDGRATAGLIMGYISIALLPVLLAVIIPNMLRSRTVANETLAMSSVRTINTAQVAYSMGYPSAGYARDLATLGPGPAGSCTQEHACLIDATLACSHFWCAKNGYVFNLTATCEGDGHCTDYVIVAFPSGPAVSGTKSFCSTSDDVVRMKIGGATATPVTPSECQTWAPEESGDRVIR